MAWVYHTSFAHVSTPRGKMEKENHCPSEEPVKKKPRLSLSLKKRRFGESVSENLTELTKPIVPKNTTKNTSWAIKNFNDWRSEREQKYPEDICRADIFETTPWNIEELNHWLSIYILETRRTDGKRYPLSTAYQLLTGLLRHMRSYDPGCPNFLDKANHGFKELHAAVDNLGRQLRTDGIGAEVKHASIISSDEENMLWEKGVLDIDNPRTLLSAVFFCNGKNFCLRGGSEHRNLKLSQFKRLFEPDRYIYTENGSKNRSGCLRERSIQNKTVPIFSCFNKVGKRCHVYLLDLYISKMPQKAKDMDYFYLRPFDNVPENPSAPWCYNSPMGEHKLGGMVKNMFSKIGVTGKTNHSLRATGATTLFAANVPEKVIQERTGHRSLKALRVYERTTDEQQQHVSTILATENDGSKFGECSKSPQDEIKPLAIPTFGVLHHCTINVNYGNHGPSTVNVQSNNVE